MKPKTVFEDETILIIDKPAGMVVNQVGKGRTVQDWIESYLKVSKVIEVSKVSKALTAFHERSGIVHRLDKETSGLLVIAKTPEAFTNLQKQFKERKVEKKYLALVHGKVAPKEGLIEVPISRSPYDRKKFGVFLGGRPAKTKYKVIAYYPPPQPTTRPPGRLRQRAGTTHNPQLTLIELSPETGRTHQLRVHLKYLGHPVVGDAKYAGRKTARADRQWCPRQFLHASYLGFIHPKTGKKVNFTSPLPNDLKIALKSLQP